MTVSVNLAISIPANTHIAMLREEFLDFYEEPNPWSCKFSCDQSSQAGLRNDLHSGLAILASGIRY